MTSGKCICKKDNNDDEDEDEDDDDESDDDDDDVDGMNIIINGELQTLSLTKPIGKGGFGTVWLAEAGGLTFAAKEMKMRTEENKRAIKKELDIMSQLNSPFVVHVYGSVVDDNSFYLVMDYVPLGSLSSAMEKYAFSSYIRCRFMLDVARGMQYLHSKGVIHRDLKPGNILVSSFDINADVLCKFVIYYST